MLAQILRQIQRIANQSRRQICRILNCCDFCKQSEPGTITISFGKPKQK